MVSHDRYFIDRLATRIFEVEDGHVHVYPGNYEDYLHRKQMAETKEAADWRRGRGSTQEAVKVDVQRLGSPANPIKLRQMQERCSFVEEEIPRVESSIADAESRSVFMRAQRRRNA